MARLSAEFAEFTNAGLMQNLTLPYFTKAFNSIELSKLPISKASRRLEGMLSSYLEALGNKIENTPQNHESMLGLAGDLNDTLRLYSQQIYWLGIVYVAAFAELKPLLTSRDLDNIKNIAESISRSIWIKVDKFFVREKTIEDDKIKDQLSQALKQGSKPRDLKPIFQPKENQPLNLDKQLKNMATVLATTCLNVGTLEKARQISEGLDKGEIRQDPQSGIKIVGAVKQIEKQLAKRLRRRKLNFVMWVSHEDDLVCSQCRELNGEKFIIDNASRQGKKVEMIPIRDTHPNCRCRLLMVDRYFGDETDLFIFAA